ncbi:MAG: vWA domain-containing protein, partial [Dongiaceae bacterium]
PLFALTQSLAVKQLYNGFRPDGVVFDCSDSFGTAAATNYIQDLNGHDIADTIGLDPNESYAEEAPGSRPDGDAPTAGTLYVTLFANDNRDFVGGATPSTDCAQPDGRKLALNLAPEAVNIEVPEIVGNTPATVHANTVHTFEAMCLALYAVVHHRSPLGQTCQPANGVPVIPPPARAAAMLTLDMSGSMSAPACPGCATRAVVLNDAVELFVRLWSAVSVPSDRIGVTYFRTDVDQFALNGAALPLLSDGADDVIAHVGGQMPGNATAMGGGLQRAIEALDDPSVDAEIRRVILFTDGMQNVNPMVLPVGGHHEIINEAGRPNSNVTPTGRRLDQLGGIAVDTIGIGAGQAFVGRLEDIADETGGRTWLTTAPDDDLRRFFVEELINALRGFSPQLVAYRRGSIGATGGTEAFAVEDGVRKLVLKVSWKRGDSIDFSVAKDGVDVTSVGRFIAGEFYRIFVIDLPAKGGGGPIAARGTWQIRIKGKAAATYEAAAIVDGGRIAYDAIFDVERPRLGDPLDLVVRLSVAGRPLNAKVTATLMRSAAAVGDIIADIQPKELPAPEPGTTPAERQLLAFAQDPRRWAALAPRRQTVVLEPGDKGEFRARFRPRLPGIYTAAVTIEGDDGAIGHFTRTVMATAVVRFANADPKASRISVNRGAAVDGRRYVTLIDSPRDARGTRMGP